MQADGDKGEEEKGAEEEEEEEEESNKAPSNSQVVSELDGKLQELHDTLSRLRRESDQQIKKLRRESEDASRWGDDAFPQVFSN